MLAFLASTLFLPVALERRVATVEAVVRELAEKSRRDLGIRPELRDEALYVNLGPREPGVLMRLVAEAASAEWSQDGDKFRLTRSPALVRRQALAERAALAAELAPRLKAVLGADDAAAWTEDRDPVAEALKVLEPLKVGPGYQRWNNIRTRAVSLTPAGRLLSRTLRALGADGLAGIPVSTEAHFASRPRRFQRPLPGLTKASYDQFVRESAMMRRRLDLLPDERRAEAAQTMTLYGKGAPTADGGIVMTATRSVDGDFEIMLNGFDAQGRPTVTARLDLYRPEPPRPTDLPGYDEWAKETLVFGPIAPIVDPVAEEPLATLVGEPVERLMAAVGGESIVALPDMAAARLRYPERTKVALGALAKQLGSLVAFARREGALVGSVRRPTEAAATKSARAPMRDLLRAFPEDTPPGLEATLGYVARQNPSARATELEGFVLARLAPDLQGTPLCSMLAMRRRIFPTLAALSRVQREALWAGRPVPFAAFGPAARAALERYVFTKGVRMGRPDEKIDDPTVWYDALPVDGVLTVQSVSSDLLAVVKTKRGLVANTPDGLGYIRERQDVGEGREAEADVATAQYRTGRGRRWVLNFEFEKDIALYEPVEEMALSPRGVRVSEFPPEHLAAYKKAYEEAKAARASRASP